MTIYVDALSFGYKPSELVLRNVSFHVSKGTFYGVIGPNGGGKSTLIRLLLGLLKPLSGSILINNMSPPAHGVAYVPQSFLRDRAFPITVLEVVLGGRARHLSAWGRFSSADVQEAKLALERVGLLHLEKEPFGSISGGQAQRVLIARALASKPSVLLLDEPTSSTDPGAEAAILNTIDALKHEMTILMVTHDLDAILNYVEGVLCLQGGAVMMHPREVCQHFALGLYHTPLAENPKHHFKECCSP